MARFAVPCLIAVVVAGCSPTSEHNQQLSISQPAPSFRSLEGVDGSMHGLDDFKDKEVVVVCFTCNHCPVATAYEERIVNFVKKNCSAADSKVGFVAINVSNLEPDKLPMMKERAQAKGFNFAYLYDPSQKVGRDYGAFVTPMFFVLDRDRTIVYRGALDNSVNAEKATTNYLEAAVQASLEGKKPERPETRAGGCGIRYEAK
jgi:peroxiredoxin